MFVFASWYGKQAEPQITPASNYWELAARREQSIGVFLMTSEQEISIHLCLDERDLQVNAFKLASQQTEVHSISCNAYSHCRQEQDPTPGFQLCSVSTRALGPRCILWKSHQEAQQWAKLSEVVFNLDLQRQSPVPGSFLDPSSTVSET